jgi:hypothetical protein
MNLTKTNQIDKTSTSHQTALGEGGWGGLNKQPKP